MDAVIRLSAAVGPVREWAVRVHLVRVLAICGIFVALLAAGLHSGRDIADYLRSAMGGPVRFSSNAKPVKSEPLKSDPVRLTEAPDGGAASRVGHLLFPVRNSDFCRRALFDNGTGASVEVGQIYCGLRPDPSTQPGDERLSVLLRSFRK